MQLTERHRPKAFDEFIGQDKAVVRVKAILGLPSFDRGAFLLTGPSGSGKTHRLVGVIRQVDNGKPSVPKANPSVRRDPCPSFVGPAIGHNIAHRR